MKTLGVFLLSLALSLLVLGAATRGFRVATAEGARRLAIEESPITIPDVIFQDRHQKPVRLSDYRGAPLLVEFIFTTCPTICQVMGKNFSQVQNAIRSDSRLGAAHMLSISFDFDNDTPLALGEYSERYEADPAIWKIVRPLYRPDLEKLLHLFGVKVIPDPDFGFQHNVAVHMLDGSGRLVSILELEPGEVIAALIQRTSRH